MPWKGAELAVETLSEVLYKVAAFTSPVGEVVAWGEDTWPSGWGLWEAPARLFFRGVLLHDCFLKNRPQSAQSTKQDQKKHGI
jgi:hypothetical protein